jgi:hypothetical protein
MVGCDHVIQNAKLVTLSGFIQPLKPAFSVFRKLKKKVSLVTTVSNVPHLIGYMMTIRSWHKAHHKPLKQLFHL